MEQYGVCLILEWGELSSPVGGVRMSRRRRIFPTACQNHCIQYFQSLGDFNGTSGGAGGPGIGGDGWLRPSRRTEGRGRRGSRR